MAPYTGNELACSQALRWSQRKEQRPALRNDSDRAQPRPSTESEISPQRLGRIASNSEIAENTKARSRMYVPLASLPFMMVLHFRRTTGPDSLRGEHVRGLKITVLGAPGRTQVARPPCQSPWGVARPPQTKQGQQGRTFPKSGLQIWFVAPEPAVATAGAMMGMGVRWGARGRFVACTGGI